MGDLQVTGHCVFCELPVHRDVNDIVYHVVSDLTRMVKQCRAANRIAYANNDDTLLPNWEACDDLEILIRSLDD